ncbi:glutamate-rich protein 3 isoform X1 [Mauremys reevesii]|uniref:glutamate-rich protein 3 isoform X1 n=1 Tax=Mauremys reevesii TaxID=260615 RepID=UPI00193FE80A|nr:glutamate-rich protein 3 isoform X1 [Mauremys reevesii]XP_039339143.1 glutamate-rich protein 3 isoform X1 [Mauremys reevesii]
MPWYRQLGQREGSASWGICVRSLATYNSLTDRHLAGYFSNTRIRRHLQRSGLISRSGRIISEKEYRLNAMRKDHQRYVRECLAQAIFHKVLDMEAFLHWQRHHQLEIKRKLENVVRKERVQRIKVGRSGRSVEDINPLLSPHPPAGPRNHYGRHALVDGEQSGPSLSSSSPRPNTAPGNMQRPVRLQPLPGYPTAGSTLKTSSRSKQKLLELEHDHQFPNGGEKSMMRLMNSVDYSGGLSPYQLPIINNYVIPVPPPPQKGDKNIKGVRHGTSRGRRFRPTTAPNGFEQLLTKDSGKFHKPSLHSNASVTMIYLGKSVHLSHDDTDYRDEIKVYQQHCGGENLCVYKGKLLEGETFHFTSKRHHGFPFSLTFFLNGIQMDRLSSCCEYKHRKGVRLGGKHGYFGFVNVDRASPCYRCIIAMGLDKKPSPPKKKMKEDYGEKQEDSVKDEENNEPSEGSVEQEVTKHSTVEISSAHGEGQEPAEDSVEIGEEEREEETQKGPEDESEDDQENASKDEYDEDFEADEEKSDEKVNEEGQANDQMNGMSKSPSDDEKDNLDHEKESKSSSQKALQASDSEKDESDGYSNSDSEEDKQDRNSASSLSSSSTLYSSEDDSEAEKMKDHVKGNEKEDIDRTATREKYGNETWESKPEENQEMDAVEEEEMDEAEETKAEAVMREEVEVLHGHMMEIHHQGTDELNGELRPVGSIENNAREEGEKDGSNTREDGKEVVLVHLEGSTVEAEATNKDPPEVDEGGDCKSVQEKIAEAIENGHHLSSEPEPSDSSTDEEEENLTSTAHDIKEDGAFLAEAATACEKQKAAEQGVQEEKALEEQEEFVAEEGATDTEEAGNETALELDLLAKKEAAAVMGQTVENVLTVKEAASEEKAIMEEALEESRVGKEMAFQGEEASEGNVAVEEDVNEGEELVEKAAYEGKVVEEVSPEGEEVVEEVPEGKEDVEEAESEAEEAVGMAGGVGKEDVGEAASEAEEAVEEAESEGEEVVEDSVAEAEKAMEKADSTGKEVAEGIELEGEKVVQEAASEGWETMGETEFVLEESVESVKVPILGAATEMEESVESRKVPIGKAVSEVEEAAAAKTSEEEEDVMETTPEEGETRNEATEEESEVEESPPLREETSLDREIKRDTATEEGAHKDGESIVEASEEEAAAEDPESEEEVVEEGTDIEESVPEETPYMGEELLEAGEEEVIEETEEKVVSQIAVPEKKLVIGKKVPVTEEAVDKSTINVEEVAEGAAVEGVVVTEGMAMEEVEVGEGVAEESAEREREGEGMSEIESEEAMSVDAAGNGTVMGNETPPQREEIVEKSELGEKENAEVLSDWEVQTADGGHEEGMEEEEAGSEEQKVMTERITPEEDMRSERTLPEVEKLMTPSSLRDEVEAVEAAPEVEGVTQEMAYHPDVVEKQAVLVEEIMAKVRHTGGNDRTEEREMETVEEKITLKQLDTNEKIKIGKTETLAEYPHGIHGRTDLLEVQHKEESLEHIKTDTIETSITEEKN